MKISRLPNGSPEIFHTLQGEGPTLGSPAVFLRLSLCNLHCHWCDTPYTWNWEKTPWPHQDGTKFSKAEQIIDLSPAQIAPLINNFHCKRLVITGGEPLLQQNDLLPLLQLLPNTPFLEIETNGTQLPSPELTKKITQLNISPKLSNSRIEKKLRLNLPTLQHLAHLPQSIFKFVVCNQSDLQEIHHLQDQLGLPPERIYLMPEGRDPATLQARALWLADICRDHGHHFSPRLHVLLWGDKRAK